jgi:tetratricopeptide (TPR) repeat protein
VGRDAELEALRERADSAVRGMGSLALVAGDPGVGKSRLLDELVARAGSVGMTALAGRCVEGEGAVAYLPFIEVLEQLARERGEEELERLLGDDAGQIARLVPKLRRRFSDVPALADVPADQARRLLFAAVCDVLERLAGGEPLLVLLEDLHWADESSLALLEHLTGRLSETPILAIGTYRVGEAPVGTPLARTLARLIARHDVLRLELPPLGLQELMDLVAALHGSRPPAPLLKRLAEDSGGNPFFLEELYQHLVERGELTGGDAVVSLPDSIRLVLGHRLERLSAACREALTLGALVGRDFDEILLAAAGAERGQLEAALDEGLHAGLLTTGEDQLGGERYRFAHALVRQAILGGLSPARRRRLHLALADAIERLDQGELSQAVELADHLERAGSEADPLRAALANQAAARRMLEVAAFQEALDRLERAVARCPAGESVHVAELLADRGNAARSLGRMEEAFADWYAALDRGGPEWSRAPRICRDLARSLDITGRLDEAIAAARRGLELVGNDPTPERARLLASLAYTLGLSGASRQAANAQEEALAIAAGLGDIRVRGDVQAAAVSQHFASTDHVAEARAAIEASGLLLAAGELWDAAQATMMRMLCALRRGRLDEAEALDDDVASLSRRSGHAVADLWRRRCLEAVHLVRTGDLDRYASFTAEDLDFCRERKLRWVADALLHAGMCSFWQGDLDAARSYLDEAASVPTPPAYIGRYSSARFVIDAWAGDERAFERHRSAVEDALSSAGLHEARTLGRTIFRLSSLEGHVLLGQYDAAADLRAAAVEASEGGMLLRLGDLRLVPLLLALGAGCTSDWGEAERQLDEARRLIDRLPHRREGPDADLFEGILLGLRAGPGNASGAREVYARATARYRRLGMPWHAQLAAGRA